MAIHEAKTIHPAHLEFDMKLRGSIGKRFGFPMKVVNAFVEEGKLEPLLAYVKHQELHPIPANQETQEWFTKLRNMITRKYGNKPTSTAAPAAKASPPQGQQPSGNTADVTVNTRSPQAQEAPYCAGSGAGASATVEGYPRYGSNGNFGVHNRFASAPHVPPAQATPGFVNSFLNNFQQAPLESQAGSYVVITSTPVKALMHVIALVANSDPKGIAMKDRRTWPFNVSQALTNVTGKFCGTNLPEGDVVPAVMTTLGYGYNSARSVALLELQDDLRRFDVFLREKGKPTTVFACSIGELVGPAEIIYDFLKEDVVPNEKP